MNFYNYFPLMILLLPWFIIANYVKPIDHHIIIMILNHQPEHHNRNHIHNMHEHDHYMITIDRHYGVQLTTNTTWPINGNQQGLWRPSPPWQSRSHSTMICLTNLSFKTNNVSGGSQDILLIASPLFNRIWFSHILGICECVSSGLWFIKKNHS